MFAYCAALAADSHWEGLGSRSVALSISIYGAIMLVFVGLFYGG